MKQFTNTYIVFIFTCLLSIPVCGQDQNKAEQAVRDNLTFKLKNYKPGAFGELFEQTNPILIEKKIGTKAKIKYSIIHDYSSDSINIESEYFFFDKDVNLLGQLSMDNILDIMIEELFPNGISPDNIDSIVQSNKINNINHNSDSSINLGVVEIKGKQPHIGSWSNGKDFFKFDNDGYCKFVYKNDTLGGKEFLVKGIKSKMTYDIDYFTDPFTLDFIVTRLDSNKEIGRLFGIIEFIGDSKMKIRLNFENSRRPINFLPQNSPDIMILNKLK